MAEHDQTILENFTRMAEAFAEMPAHSHGQSLALLLDSAQIGHADQVLDVACGPGIVACAAAERAKHVTGIDLTPQMIEQARKLQAKKGLTNIDWRIGHADSLPFEDGTFSVVMSRYAFHHLQHPDQVLTEMSRVCRPGGRVVLADVFTTTVEQSAGYDSLEKLRDTSHVGALRLDGMKALFEQVGAPVVSTEFYRLPVELEEILIATKTPADDAAEFRQRLIADIGKNQTGMEPRRVEQSIHFSFPVVVAVGRKQ